MPKSAKKEPRKRRTAEEARAAILDAAEQRLREHGPGAIRLQDVAEEVGISHPAVLHHFESRDLLVGAVVHRAIEKLEADLMGALGEVAGADVDGSALFERVHAVLFDRGHARLIAWLVLSGYDPFASPNVRDGWRAIADMTHAKRIAGMKGKKKPLPTREDTDFTILLSALALFGQALAGRSALRAAGVAADAEKRFRTWLAELLARHLRSI